jgi:phenylalanyl-tRNA synthetase alpha chain
VDAQIEELWRTAQAEWERVTRLEELEPLRLKYLGKKGSIPALLQGLRTVSSEQRPIVGARINQIKEYVEERYATLHQQLRDSEEAKQLSQEWVDVSLPGRRRWVGRSHLVQQMIDRALDILISMGFSVQNGPEIESDYYNFEALNFAPDHPARDMQDTFYLDDELLLRTHTTNIQVRLLEQVAPPIRIVSAGRVYRREEVTARSHLFFHQVDAFYVDRNVSLADLFGTLRQFLQRLLGDQVPLRFRPSYFPFVEPGVEVDVACRSCQQAGCALCKHSGWLEVLGAGMVHPEVLKNGGVDPEIYTGFAWGMGIERLVMRAHGIEDIRQLAANDMRLLAQF